VVNTDYGRSVIAERSAPDGRHIRFLAAHTAESLTAKMSDAESVEP
jgi:hypothetical protein